MIFHFVFGFDNQQVVRTAGMQAHMHLGGGKWEMVAFGKRLGALVGGFQHGQQCDIQMETVYTQYQDAGGKKVGFLDRKSVV